MGSRRKFQRYVITVCSTRGVGVRRVFGTGTPRPDQMPGATVGGGADYCEQSANASELPDLECVVRRRRGLHE